MTESQQMQVLKKGIEEINRGAYFKAHDTLEKMWLKSRGRDRDFFRGMVQVAVSLYHFRHGNVSGGKAVLESSMNLLRSYAPSFFGVDIQSILDQGAGILGAEKKPDPEKFRIGRV